MADVYFCSEYIFSVICFDLTFLQTILSFYAFFLSMSVFIFQSLSNPKFFTPDVFHFCFSHLFNLQTSLYSFTFLLSYITSSFQLLAIFVFTLICFKFSFPLCLYRLKKSVLFSIHCSLWYFPFIIDLPFATNPDELNSQGKIQLFLPLCFLHLFYHLFFNNINWHRTFTSNVTMEENNHNFRHNMHFFYFKTCKRAIHSKKTWFILLLTFMKKVQLKSGLWNVLMEISLWIMLHGRNAPNQCLICFF